MIFAANSFLIDLVRRTMVPVAFVAFILPSVTLADAKHLDILCEKVNTWKPGEAPPPAADFAGEMNIVDAEWTLSQLSKPQWVLIDARGDKERKNGFFDGVISLRSGLKEGEPDDFSKDKIIKAVADHFAKPKTTWDDVRKLNFILFCNGEKCPKGAKGGCALRKFGLSAQQINILPMSYDQLVGVGLPLYLPGRHLQALAKNNHKVFSLRMLPGMDLKKSLVMFQKMNKIKAGSIVSVAGSLKVANIRFADQAEPTGIQGPLEIVSLGGTLSESGLHVHLSVSDKNGQTWGGHLVDGNLIYTTAEITILEANQMTFKREKDPQTTFEELVIEGSNVK